MKPSVLANKVGATVGFAPASVQTLAKGAFLMNLLGYLGLDDGNCSRMKDDRPETFLAHLLGVLRRRSADVPDDVVRRAHCDMVLPWSRAIVSAALYGEGLAVTPDGVPAEYGAA